MESAVEVHQLCLLVERTPIFSSRCPLAGDKRPVDSRALHRRTPLEGLASPPIVPVGSTVFCQVLQVITFPGLSRKIYRQVSEINIE